MHSSMLRLSLILLLFKITLGVAVGQECSPPQITGSAKSANIFSPEQEMILGELTYQNLAREMRFVRDPQLVAHVNAIGAKLIKHLPPTGLKFQFFIVDIPDANAFNVAGGYVFVSRKLIALTTNEDELAGVIGHELGHAVARHGATDFSVLLKKILNVTAVRDRKDIADKYNLIIERWRTKRINVGAEEDSEQAEADRIAVFAIVAAGYDPEAVAAFFARLVEATPGSGGWFSDIFGRAKPEEKRLRDIIKTTQRLPAACRDNPKATASQDFLTWQADVVSYRYAELKEELPGLLWKKELSPKLRSDVSHFAFSNDGRFILAQDDFAVTIIQREPLAVLFQIPVDDAHPASFTPDNEFVVFGTRNLRFEKWSIADRKPVQMRELVLRDECWEHGFSPDGNYLVCFDYRLNLNVLETSSGKRIWQKKDFYRLTFFEFMFWNERDSASEYDKFFHIQFAPDSGTLLVARTNKFRFKFTIDMMTADSTDDTLLALDLKALKPVSVGGDLKKILQRPFVFLDNGRILGMAGKLEDSGVFSFPAGKRLEKFPLGGSFLATTANPNYVIVKPLGNAKMGVFDLQRKLMVAGSDKEDAALWDKFLVFESSNGEVRLSQFTHDESEKKLAMQPVGYVEIPAAPLGELAIAETSGNLQWLAASSRTRGAVWNLASGERKMFVRGFRGALMANNGDTLADFEKYDEARRSLVLLNPGTNDIRPFAEVPDHGFHQYGRFILLRKSMKEADKPKEKKEGPHKTREEEEAEAEQKLEKEVRFELRNVMDGKVVFSREFPKEAPKFFFDSYSGRLILYWTLGSDVGKARLKEDSVLAARAKELGNKDDDYLVEIVDCFSARTIGTVLLETGKGSFSIETGFSDGNWLLLRDSENRILAYSIADGVLRHRFFGTNAAINATKGLIVVENYEGELTFYSLATGDPQSRVNISSKAVFLRFSPEGNSLIALSSKQVVYAFDAAKLVAGNLSLATP